MVDSSDLSLEFFGEPFVIVIEKRDELTRCGLDTGVAGGVAPRFSSWRIVLT